MYRNVFLTGVILLTGACTADNQPDYSVSIMTFNVENLFDTQHDAGKNDRTYLPAETKTDQEHIDQCNLIEVERWRDQCLFWDWNESIVTIKLAKIADAIKQVDGKGPDIIAFQEIENLGILERLRTEYLSELGYQPGVLIEGNDDRGIDVAFLTRLEIVGQPVLHDITFRDITEEREADTRGILQTDFRLPDGTRLTGYSVHFPAPYHPTELRVDAYNTLNDLVAQLPADRLVFAAGDFNTTSEEDDREELLAQYAEPGWHIAHEYCEGCPGTSYYGPRDQWSFLDMILVSKALPLGMQNGWWFDSGSVFLANKQKDQALSNNTPARFELPEATGLSDHWPLVLRLNKN